MQEKLISLNSKSVLKETRILKENYVNTMVAGAVAPCIARSSATMILNMQDKRVLVFHVEGYQLPGPFYC